VFAYESAGLRVHGAYLASPTGWKKDSRTLPDFVLWTDHPGAAVAEVADLNGDGRADIFWNSTLATPAHDAYLGRAAGWQEDPNSAPPKALPARKSDRDVLFQVLDVYHSGHPELVYLVSGSPPLLYNFSAGAWTRDTSFSVPIDVARFDKVDLGVRFLDLNGDGRTDVAYSRKKSDGSVEKASFVFDPSQLSPWVDDKRYHYPVPTFSDDLKDLGVALVDFNGDGLTDLLVGYSPGIGQSPQLAAYENCSQKAACKDKTGDGDFWRPVPGMAPPEPLAELGSGQLGVKFADLDGDGLIDMIVSRMSLSFSELHATAYRNTGSGWLKVDGFAPPIEFARPYVQGSEQVPDTGSIRDNNVQLIDLNGDRLPDLVYYFTEFDPRLGFVTKKGAYLNTGTSWKAADSYTPPKRLDQDDSNPYRQCYFQDVNGDGLPDLIYVEKQGETSRSETYLNTGAGWVREPAYDIPAGAVYASKGDQGFRFLDLNGDRLVDIAYRWKKMDGTEVAGAFLNTGRGWQQASNSDFVPPVAFTEEGRGDLGVRPADLNGDGIADLLQSYLRDDGNDQQDVYLNLTDTPDLLLTVQDGMGSQTAVTYHSVLGLDSTTLLPLGIYQPPLARDRTYPVLDAPMPGSVVTTVVSQGPGVPPRGTTYQYGEYRVDTRSGRPLGFAVQDIRDEARHKVTHIRFVQDEGLTGSIATMDTYQGNIGPVHLTSAEMAWVPNPTYGETTTAGFRPPIYHPLLANSQSHSWDLAGNTLGAQSDTYEYDAFGNPTLTRTKLANGAVTETRNVYGDDPEKWFLGRITQSQVTSSAPGKATQMKSARFGYDRTTGQLMREVALAGSTLQVTKTYQRDAFGNKTAITTSTLDGNPDNIARTQYDDLARFPVRAWNALGQVSITGYDDASGVVVRRQHPNGVTVRTSYDSLQRVRSETSAAGVITTTTLAFPDVGTPNFVAFVVTTQTTGLPPRSAFYDAAGQVRIERSRGAGGRSVVSLHEYDSLGRLVRSSAPHFDGDTPVFLTRAYDDLDRIVREDRPNGLVLSSVFDGLSTKVTDGAGRSAQVIRDAQGHPLVSVDQTGGKTTFAYDVAGNLVATINTLGQTTSVEYNLAGQKTRVIDPALGTWEYKYDAYGNLLQQRNPEGKTVEFEYDGLGRVVKRTGTGEGTSRWEYDTGQNGLGQPARIQSSLGSSKSFVYDQLGRMAAVTVTAGADHITATQTYDALGRPSSRHFSTGLSVANAYDNAGFWTQVAITDRSHTETVWQGLEYDALGRVTKEKLGNGVVTTRSYDARTGQLTRSQSLAPDLSVLQDFTFQYDVAGNITSRAEAASGHMEAFRYDTLNRLTAASGPATSVNVSYDALGNILSKSDTGTYAYCPSPGGASRLCRISGVGNPIQIDYDSAGNITRFGSQRFNLDAEGRTLRIVESSWNYANFAYDSEGNLIRVESRHGLDKATALNLGDSQVLYEDFAPPLFPTPERTRVRHYLASPVGTLGYYEFTFWHYPGRFVRPVYDETTFPVPQRSTELTTSIQYFLQDQVGSVRMVVDQRAAVTDRLDFDPWGRRVGQKHAYVYRAMTTGFAGQDHLDGFNLIHMGGRIYSPILARFLSPDPAVSASGFSQAYNRYSYALNNPLRLIDPSGYNIFGDIWNGIKGVATGIWNAVTGVADWIGKQIKNVANWIADNWRTIVVIAASVALAAVGVPPIFIGAFAGGLNAGLYGGSFDDIMRGAIIGAISGAFAQGFAVSLHGAWLVGANAGFGGFMSAAQGGNFWRGLLSSAASQVFSPLASVSSGTAFRVAAAAAIGGAVSTAMGGSFENGAMTGAFAELFRIAAENATTRYLTQPEKDWARAALTLMHENDPSFTEDSLNFLDSVRVSTGRFMAAQGDGWVMTPDGNIYWPGSTSLISADRPSANEEAPIETFTHEIEHLYQYYAQGESVLYKGAWLHTIGRLINGDPYNIDLTKPYSTYTIEQRGEYLRILIWGGGGLPANCSTVPGGCPFQ
jgi:RHS repeat-associated protein